MSLAAPVLGFRPRDGFPQHGAFAKPTSVQVAHSSRNRARNLWNYSKIYFRNFKKITLTRCVSSDKVCLGRCSSCDFEHRQMSDGWG